MLAGVVLGEAALAALHPTVVVGHKGGNRGQARARYLLALGAGAAQGGIGLFAQERAILIRQGPRADRGVLAVVAVTLLADWEEVHRPILGRPSVLVRILPRLRLLGWCAGVLIGVLIFRAQR